MQTFTALFLLAAVSAATGITSQKSDHPIYPTGYRLFLHPSPGDGVYRGWVRIDVMRNLSNVTIDAIELDVDPSIKVVDKVQVIKLFNLESSEDEEDEDDVSQEIMAVKGTERLGDKYKILLTQNMKPDSIYQASLHFEGTLSMNTSKAFYQNHYNNTETNQTSWFAVLNMKPGKARQVFPCFDDPQLKAWLELSVAHKKEYNVLTSMQTIDVSNETGDGSVLRQSFARTPIMSVNSLALLVSDFEKPRVSFMESDEVKLGVWGRNDFVTALTKAQQLLSSVLVSLEIFLSRPYPLPHLNMVALPNYTYENCIDSWGLQLFKESDIMNGNTYWLSHRLGKAAASQWLVHLTSPTNETAVTQALATFLATVVAKQNGVPNGIDHDQQPIYEFHIRNYHNLYYELSKPKSYTKEERKTFMAITKAQLLFEMLQQVLSTSTFKLGIQNFLSNREFKMYTDNDIWSALTQQARIDGTLKEPLTVTDIAASWLKHERIPLVTAFRNYDNNSITITQEPFINHLETRLGLTKTVKKQAVTNEFWWIPLTVFVHSSSIDEKNTSYPENLTEAPPIAWLQPLKPEMLIANVCNKNQYMIINPGSVGLYIVNYDVDNWRMLADHVSEFPESVRIQLLHDSLTLGLAGKMDMVLALNMTLFLKTEQSPDVWKSFYPLAHRLRKQFLGTTASDNFDLYLQALILPPLEAVGEEADIISAWKSDFRVKTRTLLCSTNFPNCIEHARNYYSIWTNVSNPDAGMPIANIHLCPVFAYGNDFEWNFGLERLINFSPNRSITERSFLLKTISGCTVSADRYERLLNLTFLDEAANETFSDADRYAMLSAMSEHPDGYRALYYFLRNNFDELKLRLYGNLWEFFIQMAMSQFKCKPGLNKVTDLYEERKGQFANGESKAQESIESVKARVKWADEKIPPIEKWLNATMSNPWKPQRFHFADSIITTRSRKFGG